MKKTFETSLGRTVRLGAELGRGGEGAVFDVQGAPDIAAKIYLPGQAEERREKVAKMADAGWHAKYAFVAFPRESLFEASGRFAGFTMRKVGGRKPIHELYSPTDRKTAFPRANFPFLLRAADNVARAMAQVHATSCVIGDVNHSGVLVSNDATVTLIDSDSFQVSSGPKIFPCKVGVPEFTPPELQGRMGTTLRTPNHDSFGLAVLIFTLLFMGRHPFAGRYRGQGDMDMDRAIAEFRFAYSSRTSSTLMEPPPHVPTLADIPLELADAFERSFGQAGALGGRPTAAEWSGLIASAEKSLVRCTANASHHHFKMARECPWCRMERGFPGFVAFSGVVQGARPGAAIDVGQLLAALNALSDPGPAPDATNAVGPVSPPPLAAPAGLAPKQRLALGALLTAVGAAVFAAGGPGLLGFGAIGAGLAFGFGAGSAAAEAGRRRAAAASAWAAEEAKWKDAAGNSRFLRFRDDAKSLIARIQSLPGEEARRLAALDGTKRASQLRHFLERFPIDRARAKGVGDAKKLTLRSYGIETAADIERRRIESIHGFGPATASALVEWRDALEAQFVFDPSKPVAPAEIAAVRTDITKQKNDLERRSQQALAAAKSAADDATARRRNPDSALRRALGDLKQAEAALAAVRPPDPKVRAAVLGAAAVAGLVTGPILTRPRFSPVRSSNTYVQPVPSEVARSGSTAPQVASSGIQPAPASEHVRTPVPSHSEPITGSPAILDTTTKPAAPASAGPSPLEPLPAPLEIAPASEPTYPSSPAPPLMDLLLAADATNIQQRLIALGYLGGVPDGVWGPRSRAALREFRRIHGFGTDDRWDRPTQMVLVSENARRAGSTPLPPIGDYGQTSATFAPPAGASRTPLNPDDARWIQQRLAGLGYYSLMGEGIWGAASRGALQDFKAFNGLPQTDEWDAATEAKLAGTDSIPAASTFVGRFASSAAECASDPSGPPVSISTTRAEANGGICEFLEVKPGAGVWNVRARCTVDGKSWSANIRLRPTGSTLSWESEKGRVIYTRCR